MQVYKGLVILLQVEGWLHHLGELSNLKEFHPVQVAEFSTNMGDTLKPGFNWRVFPQEMGCNPFPGEAP